MDLPIKNQKPKIRNQGLPGFTLIELLVTMSVIAILAGILLPTIIIVRKSAKRASTKHLLSQIEAALTHYGNDWGNNPPDMVPSGCTQFVKFRGFTVTSPYISGAGSMVASAEALCYYLTNANLTGEPYLQLEPEVQQTGKLDSSSGGCVGDYSNGGSRNKLPEVIDSWGRPFLYNRPEFPDGSFDAHGNPIHNIPGSAVAFDLFSVGPDGQTSSSSLLPDPKAGLQAFNDRALTGGYGKGPDDITNW